MPNRDGTGPKGLSSKTGRGFSPCGRGNRSQNGRCGKGRGRGRRRR